MSKPLTFIDANGIQFSHAETIELYSVLFRLAFEQPTPDDRHFAKCLLIRAYETYPEYADIGDQVLKAQAKPAPRPKFEFRATHGSGFKRKGGRP
ncbi:hypothetical protein GCM10023187_12310 [Nibrella viscosa]|uniref:Uncharacterized protein n=1 Tax=Nibrella viscosa TaxID=1084524 RepID=A0ABP8K2V5_9BACT